MLNNFETITITNPVDVIVDQIRDLIASGQIQIGDKLPPERKLAERLGVSRSQIRDAIRKLEFYGIVRIQPQSGTIIEGLGLNAFEGVLTDVLQFDGSEFKSLVETRVLVETSCAQFAALRRTDEDIKLMQQALDEFEEKINSDGMAVEQDLAFHLKIAEASKNSVLKSIMLVITPDIVHSFKQHEICGKKTHHQQVIQQHRMILQSIIDKKPEEAAKAMGLHLSDVTEYSKTLDK